jgi:hypothetical protein
MAGLVLVIHVLDILELCSSADRRARNPRKKREAAE